MKNAHAIPASDTVPAALGVDTIPSVLGPDTVPAALRSSSAHAPMQRKDAPGRWRTRLIWLALLIAVLYLLQHGLAHSGS